MAQTGFTPIQLYSSSTAAAAPLAANLLNTTNGSEVAVNVADGKLFYKDSAGVVQVLASKASASGSFSSSISVTGDVSITGGSFIQNGNVILGVTDGDKGDIVVSATGVTWTIDSGAATLSKLDRTGTLGTVLTGQGSGVAPVWSNTIVLIEPINAQTGTTYTLALTDASKMVTLSNPASITVTVPPNSSVAFPIGTTIDFAQLGSGKVTFAQGVGVTLNATPSKGCRAQYSGASLIKLGTNDWLLVGDLA